MLVREMSPNTEFLLVRIFPYSENLVFFRSMFPYWVRIQTRKNSVFEHFSRSVSEEKKLGSEKSLARSNI